MKDDITALQERLKALLSRWAHATESEQKRHQAAQRLRDAFGQIDANAHCAVTRKLSRELLRTFKGETPPLEGLWVAEARDEVDPELSGTARALAGEPAKRDGIEQFYQVFRVEYLPYWRTAGGGEFKSVSLLAPSRVHAEVYVGENFGVVQPETS